MNWTNIQNGENAGSVRNKINTLGADTNDLNDLVSNLSGEVEALGGIGTTTQVLLRDILRMKMRQTGLNLDPNAWSDSLEDTTGINTGASSGYTFDNTNKSLKADTASTELISQTNSDNDVGVHSAQWYSQRFKATAGLNGSSGVKVSLKAQGIQGTPPAIDIYIYSDNAGNPGSSITDTPVTIPGSSWTPAGTYVTAEIPINTTFATNSYYWIVARTAGGNGTNRVLWGQLVAGTYADGYTSYSTNSGSSWTNENTRDMAFKVSTVSSAVGTVIWNVVNSSGTLIKGIIESIATLGTGSITYYISRDGGTNFTACTLDTVTDISTQPSGTNIILKAVITGNAELFAVAWGGTI